MPPIFWIVPAAGIAAILFSVVLARDVLRRPSGNQHMAEVGNMIFEGAWAFLKRQYIAIGWISIIVAFFTAVLVGLLGSHEGLGNITALGIAWRTGVAFLMGAFCSAVSGFLPVCTLR